MKLTVTSDLAGEINETRTTIRTLKRETWRIVRTISFALERAVKKAFTTTRTVETGRARASWGHWEMNLLVKANKLAGFFDAFWKENQSGLWIEQGSNVEYVPELEESHPRFAGTIDRLADKAQENLDQAIDELTRLYL